MTDREAIIAYAAKMNGVPVEAMLAPVAKGYPGRHIAQAKRDAILMILAHEPGVTYIDIGRSFGLKSTTAYQYVAYAFGHDRYKHGQSGRPQFIEWGMRRYGKMLRMMAQRAIEDAATEIRHAA